MKSILCPTRGGEQSYPNQDRAIEVAKQRGEELIFLYVTDVKFLNQTASPVVVDVAKEIDEMGEFLLAMAQERAKKAGVEATTLVKRGNFREVLEEVIAENDIGALVLGSSTEDTGVTTRTYLDKLSQEISEKTGIEVILVFQGEIVSTTKS